MKKSNYQQYFYCFFCLHIRFICILVYFVVEDSNYLTSAVFRGAAIARGRRLFQCGYAKVRRLFEARYLLEEIR